MFISMLSVEILRQLQSHGSGPGALTPTSRWHLLSIWQTSDSSPTQHSHFWCTTCMASLSIGTNMACLSSQESVEFQPLLGRMVPLASQTKVKTTGTYLIRARANTKDEDDICPRNLTGPSSTKHWVLFSYTKTHATLPLARDPVHPPTKARISTTVTLGKTGLCSKTGGLCPVHFF